MRKSTKLKIFRRKKRSVILSVLKRHSLRQHTRKENYKANESERKQKETEGRMFCFSVVPEERIIMGKNFHMEGRYHLHLSETAVRILLPRYLVN